MILMGGGTQYRTENLGRVIKNWDQNLGGGIKIWDQKWEHHEQEIFDWDQGNRNLNLYTLKVYFCHLLGIIIEI